MSRKFQIDVVQTVSVTLKESAFTEQFMKEFRAGFYPFFELSEHAQHVGQLVARSVVDEVTSGIGFDQFIEGYGRIGDFVEKAEITETTVDEVIL